MNPSARGRAVGHHEAGVAIERRQRAAQRGAELNLRGVVDQTESRPRLPGPYALGQREHMRLVFASDDGAHPELVQSPGVDRRVQTVGAQRRARRQGADFREHLERDPGRGVHREIDRDHACGGERIGGQALDREIAAMDVEPGVVEPARRLGEAERLASQLVGTDQDDMSHMVMQRASEEFPWTCKHTAIRKLASDTAERDGSSAPFPSAGEGLRIGMEDGASEPCSIT